ncbi:MAG: hypothetical protein H5T43_06830 [Methanomethylovorans sp.]|nr:hypothetical protein [Methanomethylovorans sp.]
MKGDSLGKEEIMFSEGAEKVGSVKDSCFFVFVPEDESVKTFKPSLFPLIEENMGSSPLKSLSDVSISKTGNGFFLGVVTFGLSLISRVESESNIDGPSDKKGGNDSFFSLIVKGLMGSDELFLSDCRELRSSTPSEIGGKDSKDGGLEGGVSDER